MTAGWNNWYFITLLTEQNVMLGECLKKFMNFKDKENSKEIGNSKWNKRRYI